MSFIPTGYLKHSEAINRVAEIINRRDPVPLLTQEERNILQGVRDRKERATRFQPKPVTPVPKAGYGRLFVARTPSEKYPHRFVEAEPPPPLPKISREEFKDLEAKEARIKEQHHVAGEVLRQLLYAGRVPCKTLNKNGLCIETPKHIWGGEQWDEALKRGWVEFPGALGLSVSGRPIILRDALEAAFNPDGTVKEEPRPVVSKSTAEGVELQLAPPSPAPVSGAGAEDRNDERPELKQEVEPQEKPQATPEAQTAQGSKPLSETELDRKVRAQAVLEEGRKRRGRNRHLSIRGIASGMVNNPDRKFQGWDKNTLRKILGGRYESVARLGLKGLGQGAKCPKS